MPSGIDELRKHLSAHAALMTPSSAGFDAAKRVFNERFDKTPAAIVACATEHDVVACVRFARDAGLVPTIRAGGCSPAGFSSSEGGLLIDLSKLQTVEIDPARRIARFGAGVTLQTAYDKVTAAGLMLVGGECMPVGISGLTLGGGFSLLSRSLGLSCDNLVSATVVLASGEIVSASATEEPDLFWALRGAGGGNFGVVTSLHIRLHQLPASIYCAMTMWNIGDAPAVLTEALAFFADEAPDELDAAWLLAASPTTGESALVMEAAYNGSPADGEKTMQRIFSIRKPAQSSAAAQPYATYLKTNFPKPAAIHDYFKSGFVTGALPGTAVDILVDRFRDAPQKKTTIQNMVLFELAGGAVNRVEPNATAFVHRTHTLDLSVLATWQARTGVDSPPEKAWADSLHADLAPYFSGAVYQNYPDIELVNWAVAYYGANLPRLISLKRRYDPDNVFRFAQSIPMDAPSGSKP